MDGDAVTDPYGTETAWDHLDGGGYVADAWVYTGSNSSTVPLCGSGGPSYPIAWTGGVGVNQRSGPSTSYPIVGSPIPEGTYVVPVCEAYGDTITDTAGYTSNIWDQLTGGVYISNAFLNTGVDGRTPGVPDCGQSPPPAIVPCLYAFRWPSYASLTVEYRGGQRFYGPRGKLCRVGMPLYPECRCRSSVAYTQAILLLLTPTSRITLTFQLNPIFLHMHIIRPLGMVGPGFRRTLERTRRS